MSANQQPGAVVAGYPRDSLLRCEQCGRAVVCNRVELLGHLRAGRPLCCQVPMSLFISAEWPRPGDTNVTALPLPLPGADEGTDIIPRPAERKPVG